MLPFCERYLVATTTKNDCTKRARAKQLQCTQSQAGRRLYKTGCRCTQICLSNAGIGLTPAVVRQRPSTIAATLRFVYRMRESESPLLYSTAATQHNCCNPKICLSNAGFRQPVAGINQSPNIHAQTMASPITPLTHHTPRQLFSSHTRNYALQDRCPVYSNLFHSCKPVAGLINITHAFL